MYRYRIFTLEEVNRILPVVIDLTEETQERLGGLKDAVDVEQEAPRTDDMAEESRALLNEWARLILEMGAQPKGIFTVDFRSPDPNVLWCWTPGEERITHRHFAWESFKDRISIEAEGRGWPSWN